MMEHFIATATVKENGGIKALEGEQVQEARNAALCTGEVEAWMPTGRPTGMFIPPSLRRALA